MRSYPRNSPEAAARIVATLMLADSHVCRDELAVLDRSGAYEALGLAPERLHAVIREFCEDRLVGGGADWAEACRLDAHTLAVLLDEVESPELQRKVVQLCLAVVAAGAHGAVGGPEVLRAALDRWGLHRDAANPLH